MVYPSSGRRLHVKWRAGPVIREISGDIYDSTLTLVDNAQHRVTVDKGDIIEVLVGGHSVGQGTVKPRYIAGQILAWSGHMCHYYGVFMIIVLGSVIKALKKWVITKNLYLGYLVLISLF